MGNDLAVTPFLKSGSRLQQLAAGISLAGLGSVSLVGAVICLGKGYLQGPPSVFLPLDDSWQQAWQAQVHSAASPTPAPEVTIEISGAVEKPGVFHLSGASRVQDAVLQAGGFLASADQAYIHRQLNLATRLSDQQKIYIPFQGESVVAPQVAGTETTGSGTAPKTINTATKSDFMELSGIGEVRATNIVAGQPYTSREDFLERSQLSLALANTVLESMSL